MSDDVVVRAKAALVGVTVGPWELELGDDGLPVEHQHYQYDSMDEWYDVDGPHSGWLAHCQDVADARFVAAARSLVPELVAEVERLRGLIQRGLAFGDQFRTPAAAAARAELRASAGMKPPAGEQQPGEQP